MVQGQEQNMYKKIFIIAEAGVNHNGRAETARKMVDVAVQAGADAVKFQTFRAENVVSTRAPKADYQKKAAPIAETQLEMLKKLELGGEAQKEIKEYCREKGITFLSSAFDIEGLRLLKDMGLEIFKIPSGEITNLPYLREVGKLRGKVILSSGMSDLREIGDALDVLTEEGTARADITVLHCNTEYPTPYGDVNLRAMLTIRETFGVDVGYSDHTSGIEVPIAAAALGAKVIEKHFTLDRNMEGPDHGASLEPGELKMLVKAIRNVERAMEGDGEKRPSSSEIKNREIARKSLVAACVIKNGEIFTEENIAVKRPGYGISPMDVDKIIGRTAKRDFAIDEVIEI